MGNENRNELADVLKGIGIVSVVLGHSGALYPGMDSWLVYRFVYLYHLMVFFFVSGMLYRPGKYSSMMKYGLRQLKSSVPLYVGYNFVFLLLHNIFVDAHFLNEMRYVADDFAVRALKILMLIYAETLGGALWFVPMFLFAKLCFFLIFETAQRLGNKWAHLCSAAACACVGIWLNINRISLPAHLHTAPLGIPVMYMGYCFAGRKEQMIKAFHPASVVLWAGLILGFLAADIGYIDLGQENIVSPLLFYPVTALGMAFCLSLAQGICCVRPLKRLFMRIGAASFHIMALHFVVFKCFDWVYGVCTNTPWQDVALFPTAFYGMGWAYVLLGVGLPVMALELLKRAGRRIERGFEK